LKNHFQKLIIEKRCEQQNIGAGVAFFFVRLSTQVLLKLNLLHSSSFPHSKIIRNRIKEYQALLIWCFQRKYICYGDILDEHFLD